MILLQFPPQVASDSGCVYNFLASLPALAGACGTRYMYLTSLLELSICDAAPDSDAKPLAVKAPRKLDGREGWGGHASLL